MPDSLKLRQFIAVVLPHSLYTACLALFRSDPQELSILPPAKALGSLRPPPPKAAVTDRVWAPSCSFGGHKVVARGG